MNDIVEQLRIHSDPTYPDNAPCPLLKKAADEIARLHEENRVLREECRATRLVCRLGAMHRVCGSEIEFEDARQAWHACQAATDAAKAMEDR